MKKITSLEYNSMVWFLIRGGYVGLTLSNLITICGQDSPFSGILAIIIGLIPLGIFAYLKNYNSSFNIVSLNNYVFGSFGKVLNVLLSMGGFFFACIAFLDLVHFVNSQFLFKTKTLYIAFCFIIPLIYALFKGINAISKTSLMMFYLVVFTIILILLGLTGDLDLDNLKPLFRHSGNDIIHGSLIMVAYNVLPLFFLLSIPKDKIERYCPRKTFIFYLFALLSLVNAAFLTIAVFGPSLAILYEYPEFHLLKKLQIGDFAGRLESILSLEWIIALFILITLCMYFAITALKETFNLNEKTDKILIILACLGLVISEMLLFQTNSSANNFFKTEGLWITFLFLFFVPLIIMVKCLLKSFHDKHNR